MTVDRAATPNELDFVEIGACRFAYRCSGTGDPLLLVHAGIADGRMWEPQVRSFERTHRVLVPDLRGFGHTVKPGEPYADHSDLVRLLDHLEDELKELVECGLSPYEALAAGTIAAAEYLGGSEEWGSVGAGKRADLALLEGNPLEDVERTANLEGVMARGRRLPRSALDDLLEAIADPNEVPKVTPENGR